MIYKFFISIALIIVFLVLKLNGVDSITDTIAMAILVFWLGWEFSKYKNK
ncbi:MAG: hypothetical protein ABIK77_06780 [candidate division WOR-3 bacterium]